MPLAILCRAAERGKGFIVFTGKEDLVYQLLQAKKASGKTFTQIAEEVGLTNLYTAQLFHNQVGNNIS